MNLDEMELARSHNLQEGVCDLKEEEFEEEDSTPASDKLLDECIIKLMKFLFGNTWETSMKEKSRKKAKEIIRECLQLEVVEQTENDLGETLDLLEDSLFLLERVMARTTHAHMSVEMVNHMEAVAGHLEQWGMGDAKAADKKIEQQMRDRFRD